MLRDYGTMELRDVLRFAIDYADNGYPVIPQIAGAIRNVESLFRDEWTTSADIYLPVAQPGTLHRNPQLAETYRRLAERAGPARRVVPRLRRRRDPRLPGAGVDGQLRRTAFGAPFGRRPERVAADLRGRARGRLPRPHRLQGRRVEPGAGLPPAVAAARGLRPRGHGTRECRVRARRDRMREARFADREAWYGDPEFFDVPVDELLARAYADERRKLVGETAASELRPGSPAGRTPRLPSPVFGAPVAPGVGEPTRGDTVHLDVVDRHGNMVAATPSGGWLWGAPVIPELGFCLGTRAQMFWLEEGLPNSLEPRSARGRRSRRPSSRATGSPTSRSALLAGTSRTSGRSTRSSRMCISR